MGKKVFCQFGGSLLSFLWVLGAQADWNIDWSRRTKEIRQSEYKEAPMASENESLFDMVFSSSEPIQEIVVLNTDKGFVPSTVRVRKGGQYKLYLVNVNSKDKNVSFVLDAFSEHHATYYGKIKSFYIQPKKDGVFSFQCPETSAQGRLVVYPPRGKAPEMRLPASTSSR